jgi:SAM-dependent methyltransferase
VTAGACAWRVAGTIDVVRFNWPKYLGALAILAAAAIASVTSTPRLVSGILLAAAVPGVVWTVTSLVATLWVYDCRRVYQQLTAGLGEIGEWAVVHAGFDASAPALCASIGRPPAAVAEIAVTPGPSLRRARGLGQRPAAYVPVGGIPLAAGSLDSIFLTFAAHELRDLAGQRALFRDLRQALRPGGQLVVTEHLRDLANFAVYGPGATHFQPLATWLSRAAEAGLAIDGHVTITPFVHRVVCRR